MTRRHIIIVLLTASAFLTASQGAAHADLQDGGSPRGGAKGRTLMSSVTQTRIKISGSPYGSKITPVNPDWTPPTCWYEPVATPQELKSSVQHMDQNMGALPVSVDTDWGAVTFEKYLGHKSEFSPYDDYAISQQGKGMWWRGVINPNHQDLAKASAECPHFMFWAPNAAEPKIQNSISPQILAGYAYDSIRVPTTNVRLNPTSKQTVNLPTWIWANKAAFKPISVTASLPGTGFWAKTTAKPVSLHIDPGTQDAITYPSSGDCPVSANGSIGQPYSSSTRTTPACGLTYLHSTAGSPFLLKATLTWQISWTGSGNTGGDLPDGTFGKSTPLTVQEIQTVVR